MDQHKKMLETALLAGQIMTESNAESYRVEDTMNRMLTSSNVKYAVAVSFSTSLYATLDDPNFTNGSFTGIKRITEKATNLYKIARVNSISRQLTANKITIEEAYAALVKLRKQEPQYNAFERSLGIFGLAVSFSILFGGGLDELLATVIDGFLLTVIVWISDHLYLSAGLGKVIKAFVVTIGAAAAKHFLFPAVNIDIVTVATLMPLVPGTAITNSFRDVFREDYLAGGARAIEAFLEALMIAIGAAIGLSLIGG